MDPARKKPTVEAWFDEYHKRLLGFLTHDLNVEAEADDLAQEVFLRLLRLDEPEAINHPRAFLFRIAANVVSDWRDRYRRLRIDAPETFEQLATDETPVKTLVSKARAKAVNEALKDLPPAQSAALVLRVKHGLTYKQVAEHLGVTERMVKRYVVKGYASLREQLVEL